MEERIFDNDFFSRLNKINLNINLRLSNGMQGGRKSKAKGASVEFSDFREYTYGDDLDEQIGMLMEDLISCL